MTAMSREFSTSGPSAGRRAVGFWLLAVAALIAAMVLVGGLTRLTGSGLSITEWHPVTGAIPPLSDRAWEAEFAQYKHIPQYTLENRGMTLSAFKTIYWWEWSHRLLGRLIGVIFLVPFLWFAWRGAIPRSGYRRMIVLFLLGGFQGLVGWWMVMSGLEVRVSVSQYRLAIHLGVALILFAAILWTAFEYLRPKSPPPGGEVEAPKVLRVGGLLFAALVYLQMLLGALVAGLHAGLIYNTWPSMDGRAFPEGAFFNRPWWINFFENPGLVQFDHRIGAYLIAAGAVVLFFAAGKFDGARKISAHTVLGVTLLQIALGILTLLNQVPVALAALHQIAAVALFSAALWHAYEVSGGKSSAVQSPAAASA